MNAKVNQIDSFLVGEVETIKQKSTALVHSHFVNDASYPASLNDVPVVRFGYCIGGVVENMFTIGSRCPSQKKILEKGELQFTTIQADLRLWMDPKQMGWAAFPGHIWCF